MRLTFLKSMIFMPFLFAAYSFHFYFLLFSYCCFFCLDFLWFLCCLLVACLETFTVRVYGVSSVARTALWMKSSSRSSSGSARPPPRFGSGTSGRCMICCLLCGGSLSTSVQQAAVTCQSITHGCPLAGCWSIALLATAVRSWFSYTLASSSGSSSCTSSTTTIVLAFIMLCFCCCFCWPF